MSRAATPLTRDSAGSATIELGLLAPILAAMLIGLVDLSMAYSDKLRAEQVAQRTIERIQGTTFSTALEATYEAEAAAAAGAGATADLTYWLECNATKQTGATAWANGCANGQLLARYVEIDVQRTYTPIILAYFDGFNDNGTYTVHGKAGVRVL